MKDIVIVNGARTPMAEYNGSFTDISAIDLASIAAKEALTRSGFAGAAVHFLGEDGHIYTASDVRPGDAQLATPTWAALKSARSSNRRSRST